MTELLAGRCVGTPGATLVGPRPGARRASLASFIVDGVHAPTTWGSSSTIVGITVRTGHHCAQPLHRRLGVAATARASA